MTMTREELKGKQTPGTWFVRLRCKYAGYATYSVESPFGDVGTVIADRHIHDEGKDEYMAGLFLAAEAGTVANRTGMWPEDLVARVKELEEALKQAKAMMNEARSLADAGGEWDALHAPGTLEQGIREIDSTLNKQTP